MSNQTPVIKKVDVNCLECEDTGKATPSGLYCGFCRKGREIADKEGKLTEYLKAVQFEAVNYFYDDSSND